MRVFCSTGVRSARPGQCQEESDGQRKIPLSLQGWFSEEEPLVLLLIELRSSLAGYLVITSHWLFWAKFSMLFGRGWGGKGEWAYEAGWFKGQLNCFPCWAWTKHERKEKAGGGRIPPPPALPSVAPDTGQCREWLRASVLPSDRLWFKSWLSQSLAVGLSPKYLRSHVLSSIEWEFYPPYMIIIRIKWDRFC